MFSEQGCQMQHINVLLNLGFKKHNVVYTHNAILFSLKKGISDTCGNMDEAQGHYAY